MSCKFIDMVVAPYWWKTVVQWTVQKHAALKRKINSESENKKEKQEIAIPNCEMVVID